jgi:hypothetical protein
MAASLVSRLCSRASRSCAASISAVTSRKVLPSTSPRSFIRSASFLCSCRWRISPAISLMRVILSSSVQDSHP